MKLLYLELENFKRISVAKIKRSGNVMNITGRNGQGKTSVLDGIKALLGGKDAAPLVPINVEADRAVLRGHLGDKEVEFIVTRTFEHDSSGDIKMSLKVTRPEGNKREPKGQTLLDEFYGALSFDAAAFLSMKEKEQLEIVRRMVPGVDFIKLAKLTADDYAARTDINRDAKKLEAQIAGMMIPPNLPEKALDVADLVAQVQKAGEHNNKIEARKKRRQDVAEEIVTNLQAIEEYEAKITEMQNSIAAMQGAIKECSDKVAALDAKLSAAPPLPLPIDTAALGEQLKNASAINEGVRIRESRDTSRKELADLVKQSDELTAAITGRDDFIKEAIAKAQLPVPNLGFSENGLLLDKLPFEQASYAQKLRASIAIGMKLNPVLKVILIREGSTLDRDSKKVVHDMATQFDYDVWIETVSDGKADAESFVIEDGLLLEEPHPVLGASKPT